MIVWSLGLFVIVVVEIYTQYYLYAPIRHDDGACGSRSCDGYAVVVCSLY